VALNEGLRRKKGLWREAGRKQLESFRLAPWASRRRRVLLELLDRLNPTIVELSAAIEQEVEKCPEAQRLRTHPGVGSLVANRLRAIWDWCRRRNRVETDWEKGSPRSSLGITFRVLVLVFLLFLFSFVLLFFILLLFCHFTPLPK
jgi:hypothetical protein